MLKALNVGDKVKVIPNAPFSQAYIAGDFLFVSGTVGSDVNGVFGEDVPAQTKLACENVGHILEAAGVTFNEVVKATCFLTDINDFAALNAIYSQYFTSKPARSCFAVKDLPGSALVEFEVIAYLGK